MIDFVLKPKYVALMLGKTWY